MENKKEFKYHFGYRSMKLTRVCFANDLLMFSHDDMNYVNVLKEAIEDFEAYSNKDSLWLKWINTVKPKGRSVWAVEEDINDSWRWRNIIKVGDDAMFFIMAEEEIRKRSIDELYEFFVETLRLRLSSLKAKLTKDVRKAQLNWNIKMVKKVECQ
ncbi:hypothetical protein Tco_0169231 [Tanacetum coccineum]